MLAILAFVCFILAAFGVELGDVALGWLGLAILSIHLAFPWTPWDRKV